MPKLNKDGQFIIPLELREELKWELPKEIAICYSFSQGSIYLVPKDCRKDHCVLSFRKLDTRGRISLPLECMKLLNADKSDMFVLFLKDNSIFIKKQ